MNPSLATSATTPSSTEFYPLWRVTKPGEPDAPTNFILPFDVSSKYADKQAFQDWIAHNTVPELGKVTQVMTAVDPSMIGDDLDAFTEEQYVKYFMPETVEDTVEDLDTLSRSQGFRFEDEMEIFSKVPTLALIEKTYQQQKETPPIVYNSIFNEKTVSDLTRKITEAISLVVTRTLEKQERTPFEAALVSIFTEIGFTEIESGRDPVLLPRNQIKFRVENMPIDRLIICYQKVLTLINPTLKKYFVDRMAQRESAGLAVTSGLLSTVFRNYRGFEDIPVILNPHLSYLLRILQEKNLAITPLVSAANMNEKLKTPNDLKKLFEITKAEFDESIRSQLPAAQKALPSLRANDINALKKQFAFDREELSEAAQREIEKALSVGTLFSFDPRLLFNPVGFFSYLERLGYKVELHPALVVSLPPSNIVAPQYRPSMGAASTQSGVPIEATPANPGSELAGTAHTKKVT